MPRELPLVWSDRERRAFSWRLLQSPAESSGCSQSRWWTCCIPQAPVLSNVTTFILEPSIFKTTVTCSDKMRTKCQCLGWAQAGHGWNTVFTLGRPGTDASCTWFSIEVGLRLAWVILRINWHISGRSKWGKAWDLQESWQPNDAFVAMLTSSFWFKSGPDLTCNCSSVGPARPRISISISVKTREDRTKIKVKSLRVSKWLGVLCSVNHYGYIRERKSNHWERNTHSQTDKQRLLLCEALHVRVLFRFVIPR